MKDTDIIAVIMIGCALISAWFAFNGWVVEHGPRIARMKRRWLAFLALYGSTLAGFTGSLRLHMFALAAVFFITGVVLLHKARRAYVNWQTTQPTDGIELNTVMATLSDKERSTLAYSASCAAYNQTDPRYWLADRAERERARDRWCDIAEALGYDGSLPRGVHRTL